jgi:hypothetical protein
MQPPPRSPWESAPALIHAQPIGLPRAPWRRRGAKSALILLGITLVPVLAHALPHRSRPIDMPGLTALASNLSERTVTVTCAGSGRMDGETHADSLNGGASWNFDATMRLNRNLCQALSGLLASPPRVDRDAGQAVLVVTHEATHIRLHSVDEGVTECSAVRSLPYTLDLMALSSEDAQRVLANARATHERQPMTLDGKPNPYRSVC